MRKNSQEVTSTDGSRKDTSRKRGRESTSPSHDALKDVSTSDRRWEQMRDTTKLTSFSDFLDDTTTKPRRVEPTQPEGVRVSTAKRPRDILSDPSYAIASVAPETIKGVFTPAKEGLTASTIARPYLETSSRVAETSVLSYPEPISHITDAGERIPERPWTGETALRGFRELRKADIIEMADMLMRDEKSKDERFNAVREVMPANIEYNCHSYVFTDGKGGWLTDANARMVLEQNGYKQVASNQGGEYTNVKNLGIKKGDVVAYYSWPGQLEPPHTGVITKVKGNKIFVKSKWGIFGLNEHPIDVIPKQYPRFWTIYHTDRRGGRLLQPTHDARTTSST